MGVDTTHSSIRNYVSGLRHSHIVRGYEFPYAGHLVLKLVFRGIKQLNPYVPSRALPVFSCHLAAVASVLEWSSLQDVIGFTVTLFLFMTLARLENTLLPSHKTFSSKIFLCFFTSFSPSDITRPFNWANVVC